MLDIVELPVVGTNSGQVPLDSGGFAYEVDNNADAAQYKITLPSSVNDTVVYLGENRIGEDESEVSDISN